MSVADEIVAENYTYHDPVLSHGRGLEAFKQHVSRARSAFGDLHFTIDDLIAEGDQVFDRWMARGTHTGDFLGVPATRKEITVTGMSVSRISNGKIVEHWSNWDALGLPQQLGVVRPAGEARAAGAAA